MEPETHFAELPSGISDAEAEARLADEEARFRQVIEEVDEVATNSTQPGDNSKPSE